MHTMTVLRSCYDYFRFTALLGSIVTAGFPRDRLTVTLLVLSAAGLPLQDLTYLLAIDWFV